MACSGDTPAHRGPVGGSLKRLPDAGLALLLLVLFLPLFLMVAAAVKLSSPGPVLFGHRRIGHGGRTFRCWKFRTMVTDAEARLERLLATDAAARAEWERDRKLRSDPRVTRLGRALRDYSVDELPQLVNVLVGEMSFVGPRPVTAEELDRLRPRRRGLPRRPAGHHRTVADQRTQRHLL